MGLVVKAARAFKKTTSPSAPVIILRAMRFDVGGVRWSLLRAADICLISAFALSAINNIILVSGLVQEADFGGGKDRQALTFFLRCEENQVLCNYSPLEHSQTINQSWKSSNFRLLKAHLFQRRLQAFYEL